MKRKRGVLGQSLSAPAGTDPGGDGDRLTPERLTQPAKRAARVLANSRLSRVRAALDRFGGGDADGLHDVRVALRRLRSWLRAYEPELDDTLRRKTRRRLRRLVRSTDAARDLEVWAKWVEARADLPARARAGRQYLIDRFARERDQALQRATSRLERDLPALLETLENELSNYSLRVPIDGDVAQHTMAVTTAGLVRSHHAQFARRFSRIESAASIEPAHRARIAAKRLRYLLETLDTFPTALESAAQLSKLQDLLGASHDMRLLVDRIVAEITEIGTAEVAYRAAKALGIDGAKAPNPALARVRPGLLALASHARQEADEAFEQARVTWDASRLDLLATTMEQLENEVATV